VKRRVPIIPTIVVLLAVGAMIGLGVWQLQRLQWKEALLAHYHQAQAMSADVPWPRTATEVDAALYRHTTIHCARVLKIDAEAGHNDKGETGWAHDANCELDGGGQADVVLGWSVAPAPARWEGGTVQGVIAPARDTRPLIEKLFEDLSGGASKGDDARLIAAPPLAGLTANATPDPNDIPNNHFSYAIQWFLFAATALVIYALALRKRWLGNS
jgi:surfeit locus 1 family protein